MASIALIKASDGTGNAATATVQSTRSPGATTLVVDTVDNIPASFMATMGTPHTFTDPVTGETITVISEATAVDFAGHASGTNLEIDTIAPGYTDAGSAVGDIIIIKPTTQWADNVAEVLEVAHADDGKINATAIYDSNANEEVKFVETASAVNEVTITNAATGNAPTLSATGDDTNIDLKLTPKGTGRIVVNGAGAPQTSVVATSESTSSTSFVALTTAQSVSVTVGASGILQVSIGAQVSNSGANNCAASFALSGANTLAAADGNAIFLSGTVPQAVGRTFLLTGLTPGSTTVAMQFRAAAGTATFANRNLVVVPL